MKRRGNERMVDGSHISLVHPSYVLTFEDIYRTKRKTWTISSRKYRWNHPYLPLFPNLRHANYAAFSPHHPSLHIRSVFEFELKQTIFERGRARCTDERVVWVHIDMVSICIFVLLRALYVLLSCMHGTGTYLCDGRRNWICLYINKNSWLLNKKTN
jgi:hypothetical protein